MVKFMGFSVKEFIAGNEISMVVLMVCGLLSLYNAQSRAQEHYMRIA